MSTIFQSAERMSREEAVKFTHELLEKWGLGHWHVRFNTDMMKGFLGLCSYKDECIILSAQHVDIHDRKSVENTIRHEVAHALTPGHSHDITWQAKAREVGCDNTLPCSNLAFSAEAIDAIRSGATLEIEIEEQVIRTPKYKVTRLQDKCPVCGKVAVEEKFIENDILSKRMIYLRCGHVVIKDIPKQTPYDRWFSADANPTCNHEWDKNVCKHCDAKRPFEFQVESMRALERGLALSKGFGIFHEMGLGKTIITLGYVKYHPESWPVLFVVKSGIIFQFFTQTITWLGDEFIGQVIRTSNDPVLPNFKCYFVSYDMLVHKERKSKKGKLIKQGFDIQKFIDRGIKTLVLDECQLIKNADSSRTQQVRRIAATVENVIPLSGTPWKNRGSEFFTVLNMIAPTKFNSYEGFKNRWVDYYWDGNKYKEGGIRNIPAFKEYVKDIIIRREYNEVMEEYPEVTRTLHYTELDSVNQVMYDDEVSNFVKWWNDVVIGGGDVNAFGSDNIIAKLQRMRHILGVAKIAPTLEFIDEFVEDSDKKIAVFAHHVDVQTILYNKLKEKYGATMPVLALSAQVSPPDRLKIQDEFNAAPRAILVASTLASGEGINLQTCSDAILMERQWNPANEDQAAPGRFKRIGQLASHIKITCITGYDTVDEYLHAIVERKRKAFHATHNQGEAPQWDVKDIMHELGQAIVDNYNKKKTNIKQFVSR